MHTGSKVMVGLVEIHEAPYAHPVADRTTGSASLGTLTPVRSSMSTTVGLWESMHSRSRALSSAFSPVGNVRPKHFLLNQLGCNISSVWEAAFLKHIVKQLVRVCHGCTPPYM